MKSQQGFTLIELVVVIVLLGILAAAAIPRFVDLSEEAEDAALQATVNSLQSASVLNFAQRKTKGTGVGTAIPENNAQACSATTLGPILMGGWPSDSYELDVGGTQAANGVAFCKVTLKSNTTKFVDNVPVVASPAP